MVRFHINPRGDVGRCLSEIGNCPFGGEHFDNVQAAWAFTETQNAELAIAPVISKKKTAEKSSMKFIQKILQTLPESDESIEHYVEDNWGDTSLLKAGVLNEEANWILKNGQCLGFAAELAEKFGTDRIAVISVEEESDELAWDEELNQPALDEDGSEYMLRYRNIVHAYAIDTSGNYWDIDGMRAPDSFELSSDEQFDEHSTADAIASYEGFMSEQDREWSSSLIKPMLERHLSESA